MVPRQELLDYLDGYLEVTGSPDYGPNGLQVEGRPEIRRIVAGVSASVALLDAAIERDADTVLVHHGILWNHATPRLVGSFRQRVARLISHDLNLLAYHLPLDRHPEVGTAATVARMLGWRDLAPFGDYRGRPVGIWGRTPERELAEVAAEIEEKLGRAPLVLPGEARAIRTAAIVTGEAFNEFANAVEAGVDLFITGEPKERAMDLAREEGVHVIAAGHYHTEAPGVRALADHVAARFDVEVDFVDLPNPV